MTDRTKPCPDGCGNTCYQYAKRCVDCHKARRKATAQGRGGSEGEGVTVSRTAAGAVTIRGITTCSTIPELLEQTQVDTDRYRITRQRVGAYQSPNTDGTRQLYRVACDLEPILPEPAYAAIENLIEKMGVPKAPPSVRKGRKPKGDFAAEWVPADHHFGMRSWARETGENYDLKIARKRFMDAAHDAVRRASRFPVAEWLLVIGNDLYHADNPHMLTTSLKAKNPPLDVDGRWQKMFEVGTEATIDAIELFRTVAPVTVIKVPGNHSEFAEWWLALLLQKYYRDTKDVTVVRDTEGPRSYWRWGNVLIGLTHGHKEKLSDLPSIMATEHPDWSACPVREVHTGHIHHEVVRDYNGTVVRSLKTLSANDNYSHQHGWSARKGADLFIWNKDYGLECHETTRFEDE